METTVVGSFPTAGEVPTPVPVSFINLNSAKAASAGRTGLMEAAESGDVDSVRSLLEFSVAVNAVDHHGETALMMAAAMGHQDVVRVLLEAGADSSIITPYGWNALIAAKAYDQTEVADMLSPQGTVTDGADAALMAPPAVEEPLVA
jgi:ankyrin repeat protein